MRVFRIKARSKNPNSNSVLNQREYVGLDKLRMYGRDVCNRYNHYAIAELYEFINGKWVIEPNNEKVRRLINPYARDEND